MIISADDYGISPAVSDAIRRLIRAGRISSVSCIVTDASAMRDLRELKAMKPQIDVGVHLLMTRPGMTRGSSTMSFWRFYLKCHFGRSAVSELRTEIRRQLLVFHSQFGRWPEFIDGHQHVHQLPGVREALVHVYLELGLKSYIRVCRFPVRGAALAKGFLQSLGEMSRGKRFKLVVENEVLSFQGRKLRHLLLAKHIPTNDSLLGHYRYRDVGSFRAIFAFYLNLASSFRREVFLCHPGFIDQELKQRDNVLESRVECYDFLMSRECREMMRERDITLERFSSGFGPAHGFEPAHEQNA